MPDLISSHPPVRPTQEKLLEAAAAVAEADPFASELGQWNRWSSFGAVEEPLSETHRARAQKMAERLFLKSPLAARYVETITDFVVGSGLRLVSRNKRADKVLQEFWDSPLNDFENELPGHIQDLVIYGELAYLLQPVDGFVAVTYIPATLIQSVSPDVDPDNPKAIIPGKPGWVILQDSRGERGYKVMDWDPHQMRLSGEIAYLRACRLGMQVRGFSRMLPLLDWFNIWETFSYNRLEKRAHFDSVWWRVVLQGATQDQIDKWLHGKHAQPPRPGTVFATNERATWELVTPNFSQSALGEEGQFFLSLLLGSAGLAEYTSPQAGRVERGELLDPVIRGLQARQRAIHNFYKRLGLFVLHEARAAGRLKTSDMDVSVKATRLGMRDFQRSSGAILRTAEALRTAQELGWLSPQAAAAVFNELLTKIGFVEAEE